MTGKKTRHPKLISVIPAYNSGPVVTSVVAEVARNVDYVIVVDDGSDAENKKYLEQCCLLKNVRLITLPTNKGKGYALIDGIRAAITQNPDYILTIDSDGQHDPKEIHRFKELLSVSPAYDLVIGTRQEIKEMPFRSKLGNVFTAKLFKAIFGKAIVDTQSGFRALSVEFAKDVVSSILPGRYETEMRMLVYAVESNRKMGTVEIQTIYLDNNKNSKFRPLRDSLRVLVPLSKYVGVAILSFIADYLIFLLLSYAVGIYYIVAHLIARICSGTFNFFANKRLVFKSNADKMGEAFRYIGTVCFSLSMTSLILYFLVDIAAISRALSKPIVEFLMFFINYMILNKLVFTGKT